MTSVVVDRPGPRPRVEPAAVDKINRRKAFNSSAYGSTKSSFAPRETPWARPRGGDPLASENNEVGEERREQGSKSEESANNREVKCNEMKAGSGVSAYTPAPVAADEGKPCKVLYSIWKRYPIYEKNASCGRTETVAVAVAVASGRVRMRVHVVTAARPNGKNTIDADCVMHSRRVDRRSSLNNSTSTSPRAAQRLPLARQRDRILVYDSPRTRHDCARIRTHTTAALDTATTAVGVVLGLVRGARASGGLLLSTPHARRGLPPVRRAHGTGFRSAPAPPIRIRILTPILCATARSTPM
ncbi:hypothetical protein C8R45DRAFT_935069 [Mycena sanguinolenta]|nr:hypothetical protein C8R45DRAFT_935069 [Mycena sanguinolenta]